MRKLGLLLISLLSCSGKPSATPEKFRVAVRLAEMWGHLEASKANAEAGEWGMALAHSVHPLVEGWPLVQGHLSPEVAEGLEAGLRAYVEAVERRSRLWQDAWLEARMRISSVLSGIWGDLKESPALQARVVRALLDRMIGEYREAWGQKGGNLAEYQDARGFLRVAWVLYGEIVPQVIHRDSLAAAEILAEFEALDSLFVPLQPRFPPAPVEEVSGRVRRIQAALTRVWGLPPLAVSPEELLTVARMRVEAALQAYVEGDTAGAYEAAVSAYLEGFEGVEGDLMGEGANELVTRLERLFRELREGIRAHRPVSELQEIADQIQKGLDEAGGVLR